VKDGDLFCMVGLPGGQVVCTVTQDSMTEWRRGCTLKLDYPRRISTSQQGELQISPMHPLRTKQDRLEARDVAVEVIGEVEGNCGSCTDGIPVFAVYLEQLRKWTAALSKIMIPDRAPIQLVRG
jgi:hypothetical protein